MGGKKEEMPVTQKVTVLRVIFLLAANLIHPWLEFSVCPRKRSPLNKSLHFAKVCLRSHKRQIIAKGMLVAKKG